MKNTADAAKASAESARTAAGQAALSAKSAGRKQNVALLISIFAAIGTVVNALVNAFK